MKCVELFTGGGGLALGLAGAGFEHQLMVENCAATVDTINHNLHNGLFKTSTEKIEKLDVHEVDFSSLKNETSLVAGGPPCQPFSQAGRLRGVDDARNMFPSAINAVHSLKPKAFIFENVKGLLRNSFNDHLEYIRLRLTFPDAVIDDAETSENHFRRLQDYYIRGEVCGCDYNVLITCANAADYGVPQSRHRVFIIGFQKELKIHWSFPRKTHSVDALIWDKWINRDYWDRNSVPKSQRISLPGTMKKKVNILKESDRPSYFPWVTVREALVGLPDPQKNSGLHFNHTYKPGAKSYKGHTGSPYDEPSKTIKAGVHGVPGGENMIRYKNGSVRYLTLREIARIQGFPDEYELISSWSASTRVLGNAVPVQLARAVASSIYTSLDISEEQES